MKNPVYLLNPTFTKNTSIVEASIKTQIVTEKIYVKEEQGLEDHKEVRRICKGMFNQEVKTLNLMEKQGTFQSSGKNL
jgi:hypothetical protein